MGHAIVEVAFVDSTGRALIDTLANPGRLIPWQARRVQGITDEFVGGKPTLVQIMAKVLEVIEWEPDRYHG